MKNDLKMGDVIWQFDVNSRQYRTRKGHSYGSPIWRAHWRPMVIVGETKMSWLVVSQSLAQYSHGQALDPKRCVKLSKKNPDRISWVFSEEELDERSWINDNRVRLSEVIRDFKDYETLKKVAALINFQEKIDDQE